MQWISGTVIAISTVMLATLASGVVVGDCETQCSQPLKACVAQCQAAAAKDPTATTDCGRHCVETTEGCQAPCRHKGTGKDAGATSERPRETGASSAAAPFIPDDEEYAVFVAVLFPHLPDVPATPSDPYRLPPEDQTPGSLDGIPMGHHTIAENTGAGTPLNLDNNPDPVARAIAVDYNTKAATVHRIDPEKLRRLLPEQQVRVLPDEERRRIFANGGWDAFHRDEPWGARGITYLSRVGFNPSRTAAILHVGYQGGPRVGVTYRVYLRKSPSSGKWILSGALMTRIS